MDKVLQICNTPKDFAFLYQPNLDDFIWRSKTSMKLERISGVFNDDNKFDIDLSKAQIREKELRDILGKAKVEVKTDSIWKGSKNLAVEFRCRGKPSGISVSEAEYYAFILDANTYTEGIIIIPIEKLLYLARKFYRLGKK